MPVDNDVHKSRWFSRRHLTRDSHDAAVVAYNASRGRVARKQRALERLQLVDANGIKHYCGDPANQECDCCMLSYESDMHYCDNPGECTLSAWECRLLAEMDDFDSEPYIQCDDDGFYGGFHYWGYPY